MAGWFAKLMQTGHARSHGGSPETGFPRDAGGGDQPGPRDARYDTIVQMLRDRESEERHAREKRQRWYRQHLPTDSDIGTVASRPAAPVRLSRFRTKVPCRITPEARALIDDLTRQFSGCTVTFPHLTHRGQAVMLSPGAGAATRQIGWVEQRAQPDPKRCHMRDQGLTVETDGGRMLILRFHYPPTPVRVSARDDAGVPRVEEKSSAAQSACALELESRATDRVARVDFSELRPALDLRPAEKVPSPRLVWATRPEIETMNALQSRDYESFYLRFKVEVLGGLWLSLSGLLSSSPGSLWHRGSHFTVVREPDAAVGKIYQRTVDDSGQVIDIGADRIYDAFPATDILFLYLDGDILADFADIYFTLRSLGSTGAYHLKEEFFAIIRRFWAGSQSLASRYGSNVAAVVRMSQRALPMPAQGPLLKQDWTSLRQSLIDRYGEGGRNAAALVAQNIHRPRIGPAGWPFASFPAGEVNVGLRLVYRQEWRDLGAQRGELIRTVPAAPGDEDPGSTEVASVTRTRRSAERLTSTDTLIERAGTTRNLDDVVGDAVQAAIEAMKWPRDSDGSINTGVRGLAATTDMGLESEYRESSRDATTRLDDMMLRMATTIRDDIASPVDTEPEQSVASSSSPQPDHATAQDAATYVYSRLQTRYQVLTRPAEIQHVVLIAEKLPAPAEIDASWVRRHDWILAKVLLDESFREALDSICREAWAEPNVSVEHHASRADTVEDVDAKRGRLYEHIRANILYYQRAIWRQEDPQQRTMRYRKSGKKVPLDWRFELESGGALTIDELGDRLLARNVDAQFAAYSSGREADLDQVIDPAGPIGYYANYAIYRMRPEFGGDDLFSMLHFFKSPYLDSSPDAREPHVVDPAQLQFAADPAVNDVSDEVIEELRPEIVDYVPELQLELARAQKGSDANDGSAMDVLEAALLRRHFATYLFRRERARRMTLDTDDVIIDVIRSADTAHCEPEPADVAGEIAVVEATAGYDVFLDDTRNVALLSVCGHPEAKTEWAILRRGDERLPSLIAGTGVGEARATNADAEGLVFRGADSDRTSSLVAGAVDAAGSPAQRLILVTNDAPRALRLVAGEGVSRGGDIEVERLIFAEDDAHGTRGVLAGGGGVAVHERFIAVRDDESLRPIPVAG